MRPGLRSIPWRRCPRRFPPSPIVVGARRLRGRCLAVGLALVLPLLAPNQKAAAQAAPSRMATMEFAVNESGGRITLVAPTDDSVLAEAARVRLLETVAGLRRGDLRGVGVLHGDSPAAKALVRLRDRLRCTFRPLSR